MSLQTEGSDSSLSLWIDTAPGTSFPRLTSSLEADVAIIGGGITGITAAYLLARAGRSVVLVEKGRIAMSETGHTTAHIVSATDADYRELVRAHGEENARLDGEAIRASIDLIEQLVRELAIDCGFRTVDGYLYAEKEQHRSYLERQREYLAKAGVETEWTDAVPLPFRTVGGLRFRGQRAFHPRLYLLALADAAVEAGARFFEESMVTEVENEKETRTVRAENGSVTADHVILATHVPLNDRGGLWAKMTVTRTYVVAAPIDAGKVPDALFWDTEYPYHYTRIAEAEGKTLLIVGGEDRGVGKPENDEERYRALEQYCRARYGVT
ncbi:MAG TPA: FAD-dependent oxidoreductase, partial [Thermoanaerobaculia bacterium]